MRPRVDGEAERFAENGDADLKADSCEEADEHGLGEEVGDEAEAEEAAEQQESGDQQGDAIRQERCSADFQARREA